MIKLAFPFTEENIRALNVGDEVLISGIHHFPVFSDFVVDGVEEDDCIHRFKRTSLPLVDMFDDRIGDIGDGRR